MILCNVYDVHENKNTNNFSGYEIIIDGETGRASFPGCWDPAEAKRHYIRGVPWSVPLRDCHTYVINLDGAFYALAADTFMTTIYAIGPDRQEGKTNVKYLPHITGTNDARDNAIRSVCLPHDYKMALNIAKSNGIYTGQLYSN